MPIDPILPSQLLAHARAGSIPPSPVAVDTETSGLFGDSGARISTVSVAWIDNTRAGEASQTIRGSAIQTEGWEAVHDGIGKQWVVSVAWAFDQGLQGTGKPEDSEVALFGDAQNLDCAEWYNLLEWLARVGADRGLVMHHAKFDCHMFAYGVRRWPGEGIDLASRVVWDTQNVADLLTAREIGSTSLKPTAAHYWGAAETDEQAVVREYLRKQKLPSGRWDLMPWEAIARYADQDARLTIRLWLRQTIDLEETRQAGWLDGREGRMTPEQAVERRLAVSMMLLRMERRGLPFDVEGARAAGRVLGGRVAEAEAHLPFQPATLPAAKLYWFGTGEGRLGLTPGKSTERGAASVDQEQIADMVTAGVPGALEWDQIKRGSDALSRWYVGWTERAGADGRLRTSVRQNGTASGRFSVENIQLQAIPHDYKLAGADILDGLPTPRALIGAGVPEGWELWELDLAQAELRVAALYAQCRRMLELIDEGADLHGDAAEQLFGVKPGRPEWGEYRQVAKRANFSLIFGVGAETLQADIKKQTGVVLSLDEARALVNGWNDLYPEYRRAIVQHDRQVMERYRERKIGWITTANGERRWFRTSDVREQGTDGRVRWGAHKAFNQRVQPNLAQFGLDWWLAVDRMVGARLTAAQSKTGGVVLTVHDSVVLLLPAAKAEATAREAQRLGRALWSRRFPGVPGDVDIKRWSA